MDSIIKEGEEENKIMNGIQAGVLKVSRYFSFEQVYYVRHCSWKFISSCVSLFCLVVPMVV